MNSTKIRFLSAKYLLIFIPVAIISPFGSAEAAETSGWGYIDQAQRMVIKPRFDSAWEFWEGLATVKIGHKWGYVDRAEETAINPQFDSASRFSEGLGAVKVGHRWGYIDKTAKIVINTIFNDAGLFSQGLAAVMIRE